MKNDTNKFVQIRFESNKSTKALGMILHNTRKVKPNYLRSNLDHNKETNTFYIFNDTSYTKYDIENKSIQTKVNNILKKQLQDNIDNEKNINKNFREKKHAIYQDSVITLSNSINDMYSNNEITKDKLNELFLKSAKELSKQLDLEPLYISIHYDEKTPHAHITYKNYYDKKSINNKLKKSYSKAQDIVGNTWEDIGFKRGISKNITKARHLTIPQMHQKEKEIFSLELNKKLKSDCLKIVDSSTKKTFLKDAIDRKTILSKIYTTLKQYSNISFISKIENDNELLKYKLNQKQLEVEKKDSENQTLLEKIKLLINEKTNTNNDIEKINIEVPKLIEKIKEQSHLIKKYLSIFEKYNINVDLEMNNEKSIKKDNKIIDF